MKKYISFLMFTLFAGLGAMEEEPIENEIRVDLIFSDNQKIEAHLFPITIEMLALPNTQKNSLLQGQATRLPISYEEWRIIEKYFKLATKKTDSEKYISQSAFTLYMDYKTGAINSEGLEKIRTIAQKPIFQNTSLAADVRHVKKNASKSAEEK